MASLIPRLQKSNLGMRLDYGRDGSVMQALCAHIHTPHMYIPVHDVSPVPCVHLTPLPFLKGFLQGSKGQLPTISITILQ